MIITISIVRHDHQCCCYLDQFIIGHNFIHLKRYKHFNAGPINAVSFSYSLKTVDGQ